MEQVNTARFLPRTIAGSNPVGAAIARCRVVELVNTAGRYTLDNCGFESRRGREGVVVEQVNTAGFLPRTIAGSNPVDSTEETL